MTFQECDGNRIEIAFKEHTFHMRRHDNCGTEIKAMS